MGLNESSEETTVATGYDNNGIKYTCTEDSNKKYYIYSYDGNKHEIKKVTYDVKEEMNKDFNTKVHNTSISTY